MGNLGGVSGADALCQAAASAPGVAPSISQVGSANWVAWVSDGTSDVSDRMLHSAIPFVQADNTTIAFNWYDLVYSLRNPPTLNQFGLPIPSPDDYGVWTGTWAVGLPTLGRNADPYGGAPAVTCNNWTTSSAAEFGSYGYPPDASFQNGLWSMLGNSMCDSPFQLMCVQSNCPAVTLPTNGQCIVFVTNATHNGTLGGFKGADDICNAAASSPGASTNVSAWASSFRAWLGGEESAPVYGFDRSGVPYRLPDGTTLAPNWDGLINLFSPLNINEFGTYHLPANQWWSGVSANTTEDLGTFGGDATSCAEWNASDEEETGSTGDPSAVGTGGKWSFDQPMEQCYEVREIVCFQQGCQT